MPNSVFLETVRENSENKKVEEKEPRERSDPTFLRAKYVTHCIGTQRLLLGNVDSNKLIVSESSRTGYKGIYQPDIYVAKRMEERQGLHN